MLLNHGSKGLLRALWTARRFNQSILKEISPEYSLEGLMLKLKLQYFGSLMQRTDSFEKTLMLGKIESGRERDDRGWDGWMASPMWWTWVWVRSRSWWWTGKPGMLQSIGLQRNGHDWVTKLNWLGQAHLSRIISLLMNLKWPPFNFFFKLTLFVFLQNLAVPGPSCSVQDLCWGLKDLVLWPGLEPEPPALGAGSLNHWSTREVLPLILIALTHIQRW